MQTIFENCVVRTMDAARPVAEAVLVEDNRIVFVGTRNEVFRAASDGARIVDCEGGLCLPGFVDTHMHAALQASRKMARLEQAESYEQCLQMIRDKAVETAADGWVLGQGFNETEWADARMPLRRDLDALCDQPVIVWRCDLHLAVANSKALELSGIENDIEDPEGGAFGHYDDGELNGVVKDAAIGFVNRHIPEPEAAERAEGMVELQERLHRCGLTGVHDVRLNEDEDVAASMFAAWQMLDADALLKLRVWTGISADCRELAGRMGIRSGFGNDMLRVSHVKYFLDGGMGAGTAWMIDPYPEGGHGLCCIEPEELEREIEACEKSGLAAMVHTIGDRASRELVDVFERIEKRRTWPKPSIRHRIEHIQMIRPEDIERLARLDIPVSVQPANLPLDINMIDERAGGNGKFAYTFRTMLDAGLTTLFSSDCPVCAPEPLEGIHAAVNRTRPDGTPEEGWYPEQCVSVEEAVHAVTKAPAIACGQEDRLGCIALGYLADMIVLDCDIFTAPKNAIREAQVRLTMCDGEIVYQA